MGIVGRGRLLVGVVLPARSAGAVRSQICRRWQEATASKVLMPSLIRQIKNYFVGRGASFTALLDVRGLSPFQVAVLNACRHIPAGCTASYGNLAAQVGRPKAARAVGGVMARNPFPLAVPCHRVVASGGHLGGFSASGGVELKARLLNHERRHFGRGGKSHGERAV